MVSFILGGIMNHVRGGLLTKLIAKRLAKKRKISYQEAVKEVEPTFKTLSKNLNAIVYAFLFSYLIEIPLLSKDWFISLAILYGSMRGAMSMGWGGYISSMIDKKIDHNRDDVLLLDKWFRGNDEPVLSGWAALSLRGFICSTILYLGFLSISHLGYELSPNFYYISFVGLSMGTCYLIAILMCEKLTFRGNGWQYGELLFGGVLWQSIACLIS